MMRQKRTGVVLFGVPLDLTSSYRSGTRFGPTQIREAEKGLEDYSVAIDRDVREVKIVDQGDLELPPGNLERCLAKIEAEGAGILERGMPFVAMGGEHLITLPLVTAALARYPDLVVLQMDAHADLAETYSGEQLTHATVMRRVAERLGSHRVIQTGIRSATAEEVAFARERTHLFLGPPPDPARIGALVSGRPVYLTIDIDVVDPAFGPGVSTPEPGGWTSREVFHLLSGIGDLHVVAMDLVEVCPPYDPAGITAALAAKVIREALVTFFHPA